MYLGEVLSSSLIINKVGKYPDVVERFDFVVRGVVHFLSALVAILFLVFHPSRIPGEAARLLLIAPQVSGNYPLLLLHSQALALFAYSVLTSAPSGTELFVPMLAVALLGL